MGKVNPCKSEDETVHTPFLDQKNLSLRKKFGAHHHQSPLIAKHLQELLRKIQSSLPEDESLAREQEEARGDERKGGKKEKEAKKKGRGGREDEGQGRKSRLQELQPSPCCRQQLL